MKPSDLRVALFSGNYNMTLDGANKALNRLVEYLLREGAAVRVYSPTVEDPDFAPTGDLVSLPSAAIPMRGEYRIPLGLPDDNRADLEAFAPNIVHLSSPDPSAHAALKWARAHDIPVLASVHTRFETYPRFYKLGFTEPLVVHLLRRFYQRCDALVAPSDSMISILRKQGMNDDISLWTRGVDRTIFRSNARDMDWRRAHDIGDSDAAIVFLGRLVMEKGLDIFAEAAAILRARNIAHKVLVIGDGPARKHFEDLLTDAVFTGFQTGENLARILASGDVFFNPSVTEAFGNVTLEAMACGLPVVASRATGSANLVADGVTGTLVPPGKASAFADALAPYCRDPDLRKATGIQGEEQSKRYSWDAINQSMLDTYLRLIDQREGE